MDRSPRVCCRDVTAAKEPPLAEVHAFTYRVPRLSVELPIELNVGPNAIQGRTRDISETGMLVQLAEPVLPQARGTVRLRFGACQFEIQAVVAYTGFFEAGLCFCFASHAERDFVKILIRLLAKRTQGQAPSPQVEL